MGSIVILLAWTAAVAAAHAVITRPWKYPAARAPLVLAPAVAMAAWVLGTGIMSYNGSMAQGSWTAASVTLGLVPLKAIILSLLAHGAGRAALKGRETRDRTFWTVAAALIAVCLYSVGADVQARRSAAIERHAADETLPPSEVAALAAKVRAGAASKDEAGAFIGNKLCPPDLLAEYANSTDPYRRKAAARNSALDAASAERLIADTDEEVRYYVAFNPGLTPDQLARLAADTSPDVRGLVARMSRLPDAAFAALADDPDAGVRVVVALQARTGADALAKLRNDPDERVRSAAGRRGG